MKTKVIMFCTCFLFTASSVIAGTIFEWREYNSTSQKYEKPSDKNLTIEFVDSKVAASNRIVGISNNILSLSFDYFSVGDGFVLDLNDLYNPFLDPGDLVVEFSDDAKQIEFLQLIGHETSQATIWIGGFDSSNYEGVMRFRGNLDSQPFDYALTGRQDNNPSSGWDYTSVSGRFMLSETGPPSNVPEPATILLFGSGLAGFVGSRIRRKEKA